MNFQVLHGVGTATIGVSWSDLIIASPDNDEQANAILSSVWLAAGALGRRGWVVRPVQDSLMLFKGDLLHGVLPPRTTAGGGAAGGVAGAAAAAAAAGAAAAGGAAAEDEQERLTLMIGWWTRGSLGGEAAGGGAAGGEAVPRAGTDAALSAMLEGMTYRPVAPVPPLAEGAVTWPAELAPVPPLSEAEAREWAGRPVPVEEVSPVWADVPPPQVTRQLLEEGPEELPATTDQKFFVHSIADLRPCA